MSSVEYNGGRVEGKSKALLDIFEIGTTLTFVQGGVGVFGVVAQLVYPAKGNILLNCIKDAMPTEISIATTVHTATDVHDLRHTA